MSANQSVITVMLLVLVAMVVMVNGAPRSYRFKRSITDYDVYRNNVVQCSTGMSCSWALCPWVRSAGNIRRGECEVIENLCRCPRNQMCVSTNQLQASSATHLTIHYRCRDSEEISLAAATL